jgi:hypothetical protein
VSVRELDIEIDTDMLKQMWRIRLTNIIWCEVVEYLTSSYTHTHTHTHTYEYLTSSYINTHTYTHTHTHTHTHTYTHPHTRIDISIRSIYIDRWHA